MPHNHCVHSNTTSNVHKLYTLSTYVVIYNVWSIPHKHKHVHKINFRCRHHLIRAIVFACYRICWKLWFVHPKIVTWMILVHFLWTISVLMDCIHHLIHHAFKIRRNIAQLNSKFLHKDRSHLFNYFRLCIQLSSQPSVTFGLLESIKKTKACPAGCWLMMPWWQRLLFLPPMVAPVSIRDIWWTLHSLD